MNELAGVSEAGLGEAAAAGTDPLTGSTSSLPGVAAAEHLPPAFPERAAWGTVAKLRAWQEEAIASYFASEPRDFLAAATPGAGKTTFALRLAAELRARRTVDQIIVVAPTEHLKKQWADAAARAGIRLDPGFSNAEKRYGRSFHGIAVTYAQLAARPALHREITESKRSLVILDEVHHGGDSLSWGDAVREAYSGAERRLSLTGTPFRSDTAPIPFVEYAPNEHGIRMSRTDYSYGYGRALRDGVVRPVLFMVYAGHMRWRTKAGDEMDARLGDDNTPDITAAAWRTALEPSGEWIQAVLASANRRLSEVREQVHDAGGLVIASDQALAREYAAILHGITGEAPTLVLSDEPASSERIETFAKGSSRWMVAVRMVSEGVDVPRLSVGVYATSAATPLYFAQAIGRFVRARRRGEMATVFVPNVPILLALAAQLELERDHALDRVSQSEDERFTDEDAMVAAANREERASEALLEGSYAAIASAATFDRVMYDGHEYGTLAQPGTPEEHDFIGIPGLLEPEQVAELLRHRQARQARRIDDRHSSASDTDAGSESDEPVAIYRTLKEQRQLLNSLVALYARQSGQAHGLIHAELRRSCGGPAVSGASVIQLQHRIDALRRRLK